MYGQWMQLVKERLLFALSGCLQSPCRQGFSFFAPRCQPCADAAHQTLPSCCICWKIPLPKVMPSPAAELPGWSTRFLHLHQQKKKFTFSFKLEGKRTRTVTCSWWQTLIHPIIPVLWWDSAMDSLSPSIFVLKRSFAIVGRQIFHVL